MVRILGGPDTDEKGELDELEETMCCLRLLKRECKGTVCLSVWIDLYTGLILSGPQSRYLYTKKAPRPHQFYMRGMNATSAPPVHSLRSSCVNHARFIRNSLATVRWLCVVFRRVFVTHNHAFALFGAFSCLCAEGRGLLVICAWSFRSSCAIPRWFFIT